EAGSGEGGRRCWWRRRRLSVVAESTIDAVCRSAQGRRLDQCRLAWITPWVGDTLGDVGAVRGWGECARGDSCGDGERREEAESAEQDWILGHWDGRRLADRQRQPDRAHPQHRRYLASGAPRT